MLSLEERIQKLYDDLRERQEDLAWSEWEKGLVFGFETCADMIEDLFEDILKK